MFQFLYTLNVILSLRRIRNSDADCHPEPAKDPQLQRRPVILSLRRIRNSDAEPEKLDRSLMTLFEMHD